MLIISELGLRALLRGMPGGQSLDDPSKLVDDLFDDLWTQMRIEGHLEDDWEHTMKFERIGELFERDEWTFVPFNLDNYDDSWHDANMCQVNLDELMHLLNWWSENSNYITFGGMIR